VRTEVRTADIQRRCDIPGDLGVVGVGAIAESRVRRLEDHERDLALGPHLIVAIGAVALAHSRP
jgi:hypothetical protein